jgi:predicted O-methyltransferase YrrM
LGGQDGYLYTNRDSAAEDRLLGLESIEDPSTIDALTRLGVAAGWHCLEIGAGAGSIARWLAERIGATGRLVATDIETRLLDSSAYEVWRHNIMHDALPKGAFHRIHLRHVLIHIDRSKHPAILRFLRNSLTPEGVLLAEESDLDAWRAGPRTPEPIQAVFARGIDATLSICRSRLMNTSLGNDLISLVEEAGCKLMHAKRRTRHVVGGSAEARFQQISAMQLARSLRASQPHVAAHPDAFADCFVNTDLEYQSRATISVAARRGLEPAYPREAD